MLRYVMFAVLSVFFALPTVAEARIHYVIITTLGFFPQTTYVDAGDVVFFKNDDELTHKLAGAGSAGWPWSVTVAPAEWGVVYVTKTAESTYNSVTAPLEDGVLSFQDPPHEAQAD